MGAGAFLPRRPSPAGDRSPQDGIAPASSLAAASHSARPVSADASRPTAPPIAGAAPRPVPSPRVPSQPIPFPPRAKPPPLVSSPPVPLALSTSPPPSVPIRSPRLHASHGLLVSVLPSFASATIPTPTGHAVSQSFPSLPASVWPLSFPPAQSLASSPSLLIPANRRLLSLSPHFASSPNFSFPANCRSSSVLASPCCFVSPLSSSVSARHSSRSLSRSSSRPPFFASPASLFPASVVPAWSAGVPLSFPPGTLTPLPAPTHLAEFAGAPLPPHAQAQRVHRLPSTLALLALDLWVPLIPITPSVHRVGRLPSTRALPLSVGVIPPTPPRRGLLRRLPPLVPPMLSQTWLPLSSI